MNTKDTQHNEMHERFDKIVDSFGDIWVKELDGDFTESGCPKFIRINRELKQSLNSEISLAVAKRDNEILSMILKEVDMTDEQVQGVVSIITNN